jgi:hypothetical protein
MLPPHTGADVRATLFELSHRFKHRFDSDSASVRARRDRRMKVCKRYIPLPAADMPPPRRPKIDPIARVQSHGLRRKLREYYEVEGSGDPIPIQFPTGRYLPILNCIMAQKSGMGETFDAQTGNALRDPTTLGRPAHF